MAWKLDSEIFIDEVKKRPAIWDYNSDEYSDKDAKKIAWKEIIDTFIETEDATDIEMAHFERELQRKWKNLRDCFSREISRRKQISKGVLVPRRNTYRYFEKLYFLKPTVKHADALDADDEVTEKDDSQGNGNAKINETSSEPASADMKNAKRNFVVVPDRVKKVKRGKHVKVEENEEVEFEDDPIFSGSEHISNPEVASNSSVCEEDDDKLFFLSLVRPFKDIPRRRRFKVRMELMEVIHKAQKDSY